MMSKLCQNCGKPIDSPRYNQKRKYCSKCVVIENTCPVCGKKFFGRRAEQERIGNNKPFCSHECHSKSLVKGRPSEKRPHIIQCEWCHKDFPQKDPRNRFCCHRCAGRYSVIKRDEKLGWGTVTYQCEYCGKTKTAWLSTYSNSKHHFCGAKCAFDAGACNGFRDNKIASGKRTSIESIVEQFLIGNNVPYHFELQMGRYFIDFAISDMMLAIECDGAYWHSKEGAPERDARKDKFLVSKGWTVIRLSEKAILDGTFKDSLLIVINVTRL